MAETRALSQGEIDALLNQIPEGAAEDEGNGSLQPVALPQREGHLTRAVKPYDFRRPDKFSKEQWTTIQTIHENLARQIGASFSSHLRTLVTVRLSSIEQGLYDEWQSQVPTQTACYVIGMAPLPGSIAIEFNQDVAAEVIDRLLGGTGILIDRGREVTEIESQLLRSFAVSMTAPLADVWRNITVISPALQDLVMDASVIHIAEDNDVVITAFFEVNLGNHLGAMSICTPYSVVEPIVSKLSTQVWRTSDMLAQPDGAVQKRMRTLLRRAVLELVVKLGSATVPARSIVGLEVGDTLVLESLAERPIEIEVGGRARFFCRPGVVGKRMAVSITGLATEVLEEWADTAELDRIDADAPAPEVDEGEDPAEVLPSAEPEDAKEPEDDLQDSNKPISDQELIGISAFGVEGGAMSQEQEGPGA